MTKIQIDTRQQAHKHDHVDNWFTTHGVDFFYKKLDFGDYAAIGNGSNVSVDTKQSMDELASNLGREHARFARECDRARADGYRLVILTEAGERYNDVAELSGWLGYACRKCRRCDPADPSSRCTRYRSKPMTGARMLPIMASMERKYGTHFYFCDRRDTARAICDILGVRHG